MPIMAIMSNAMAKASEGDDEGMVVHMDDVDKRDCNTFSCCAVLCCALSSAPALSVEERGNPVVTGSFC